MAKGQVGWSIEPLSPNGNMLEVEELLEGIHRWALPDYRAALLNGRPSFGELLIQGDNRGVLCGVASDESWQVYLAFRHEVADPEVVHLVWQRLEDLLESTGKGRVILHLSGWHLSLAPRFHELGYEVDVAVVGYALEKDVWEKQILPREFSLEGEGTGQGLLGDLTLEHYQPQKLAEYLRLFGDAFYPVRQAAGFYPFDWYRESPEEAAADFAQAHQRGEFWAFWRGKELVGACLLDGDEIDTFAVHPRWQRQGNGRRILHYCAWKMFQKCSRVYLTTLAGNFPARLFYERNGFSLVSCYTEHIYNREKAKG